MRRIGHGITLLAASVVLLGSFAVPARADLSKLDPLARRALTLLRAGASRQTLLEARATVTPSRELDVFIVGSASRAELEAAGARVRTVTPEVATAFVPEAALERVAALPKVRSIRGAARVKTSLDVSTPLTGVTALRGAPPGFAGLNGAGVLVGDVDTGVDYDHGDFKDPGGATRLVNIWDQTDAGGPSPAVFGYGSEWNAAGIDGHTSRQVDTEGHGTHVLGIAGGDGSATGGSGTAFTYVGMAPRADLVMVKTDLTDTGILDGVDYIMRRATALAKNAVVNLSLGGLYGPKDGTSPLELGLSSLTGPGRIIVVAAGNEGGTPVHAQVIVPAEGSTVTTMNVPTSSADDILGIDGYYAAGSNLKVQITTPRGTVIGPLSVGGINSPTGELTPDGVVYLENGAALTAHGDRQVYAEILRDTGTNIAGTWTFTFINGSSSSHDETTENLTGAGWNAASGTAATPGSATGVSGAHLLITEVGWRGLNSASLADSTEFIEIMNPTASTVDLSRYYLSDVNAYATLPVLGTIDLNAVNTDFAMKFPNGATIAPGAVKVIAIDGGRYKRGTGVDANYMFFNAGGGATTAAAMTDVATNKGGAYPGFGSLTNGGEFVWLFTWDGGSDLVCDADLVYWGSTTGANHPARKLSTDCQDGPDGGSGTSCYLTDAGNPAGSLGRFLSVPSSGSGTRQRTGPEGSEDGPGNGCALPGGGGGGSPVTVDQWIFYDTKFDTNPSGFVIGNDPTHVLVSEPANAESVITVGAWVTRTGWVDCGGRNVSYVAAPAVGDIADFSGPGPTRDGRHKPDLAAPGMGIASANSFDVAVSCPATASELLGDGMQHVVFAGTSMAAPHVAGAVALLLQKYGALSPSAVKSLLYARAKTDGFTGATWNRFWGQGKLFLGDLTDPTAQVLAPNGGEALSIDSHATIGWSASDPYLGVTTVDLMLTRNGGALYEPLALGVANTGSFDWTVTGPISAAARVKVIAHDAAGNAGEDSSDAAFSIVEPTAVGGDGRVTELALSITSGNPSLGSARMSFAVPRTSPIRVEIFDVSGRRVAALANGVYSSGTHAVRWEGGAADGPARAGVYFARLTAPDREIVRRFVLAR